MKKEKFLEFLKENNLLESVQKFRLLEIRLTDKESKYNELLNNLINEKIVSDETFKIINELNKQLKRVYTGKFKFDYVINDGKSIDEIDIKKIKKILSNYHSINI